MNLAKLLKDNVDVSSYTLSMDENIDDVSLVKGVRDILDIGESHGFFELVETRSPMISMNNNYSQVLYIATHQMAFFSFTYNGEFGLFGICKGMYFPFNPGLWAIGQIIVDGHPRNCIVGSRTVEESVIFLDSALYGQIIPVGFHGADLSRETLIHGLKLLKKYVR